MKRSCMSVSIARSEGKTESLVIQFRLSESCCLETAPHKIYTESDYLSELLDLV